MRFLLSNITMGRTAFESLMAKGADETARPTREEVARLAFEFYERRSRADGNDIDDWLRAESELRHHYT